MEGKDNRNDFEKLTSILRQSEPRLKDPERLTDDIMQEILSKKNSGRSLAPPFGKHDRIIAIASRVLAAASVCLFLVFGYEQYVVVDKIGRLEKQNATVAQNADYSQAIKINHLIALVKSDPDFLNHYKNLQKGELTRLNILKAAIVFDLFIISGKDSIHQNLTK